MQKNVMSEVVKLLGLEIGESFMVDECIYMIDKLPWKPKKGDAYYTFEVFRGKWVVRSLWWTGAPCNYALLDKGWVFRTKEEAEDALTKVAAEMGVEYEI